MGILIIVPSTGQKWNHCHRLSMRLEKIIIIYTFKSTAVIIDQTEVTSAREQRSRTKDKKEETVAKAI